MNDLPVKEEKGFIAKIKKLFRGLFYKEIEKVEIKNSNLITEKDFKNKFDTDLNVLFNNDYSNKLKKDEFMKSLTKHPDLLENFSIERLEKILEYYINENNRKKELLKKLKG